MRVDDLAPDTLYDYTLTLDDARPAGPQGSFTSFPPDREPRPFAFAFGSCFRPADADGGQIFNHLDGHRRAENLRFILLLGDQIYAHDKQHNQLKKVATTVEDYRDV